MTHPLLELSNEVKQALNNKKPIVALESGFISHGLPYPDNLEIATLIEEILRERGVVPATIGLCHGKIQIGLSPRTLEQFATSKDIKKVSRHDLSFALSQKQCSSANVSATIYCAYLAKIPIFVTGGIGGTHDRTDDQLDVSSDLFGLSVTPLTVVCSGAKSIIDLPKTLKMLETQGVPVIGYQTDDFPAYYSHSSGIPLFHRLNTPKAIASLMQHQRQLQLNNGIVIANPIPKSAEIPDSELSPIIKQAQHDAQQISGKAITPFLLQRIAELTAGQSILANKELFKSNAILGAQIALAYQKNNNPS